MNANGRRCRQFQHGFAHLSPLVRPRYKKATTSIHEAIERERAAARRQMEVKKPK